jgi:hypothetical protein
MHLAEALVLLHGDSALDDALRLAHNFNTAAVQQHSRRRILDDVASTLRDQLAAVERQMHEAACDELEEQLRTLRIGLDVSRFLPLIGFAFCLVLACTARSLRLIDR